MMETLYLLPGTMCDERMWQPMLSSSNQAFHPEYLTISSAETIDDIVLDIAKQLPDGPVNLLGFSLGGYLACAFSVRFPERVKTLYVIANMPCALPDSEVKERTRTVNWIRQHGYRGIPTKRILNLLSPSAHQNNEIVSLIRTMDADLGGEVLMQQLLATTQRVDLFEQLSALTMKKYFCVGVEDTLVDIAHLQKVNAQDEHMELTLFQQTGHMLPLEQSLLFSQWLNDLCLLNK